MPIVGPQGSSSTRRILLLGFALIFGLWFVASYALVQRVTELERQSMAVATRFTAGEELLFTIRAQVLLSSIYVRDAALDPRPDAAAYYREQSRAARAEIDRAGERYLPDIDSSVEREHWRRLETALEDYWTSMAPALTGPEVDAPREAQAFLRQEVLPRRDLIVRISDDIRALNQDAFEQERGEVARLHRTVRQRVWWTSGAAVSFALAIAIVAARHAGRLEWRILEQHLQERQHTQDLLRLSAELVNAQENERRTIGRDLHDEIGQALLAIKLDLGAIERSGHVDGPQGSQALASARATTDAAIRSVRDLSQLLHPAMLDEFGLAITLEAYVRSFSARTGIRTEFTGEGVRGRHAPEVEVCAYRVVQEALTNVAKHANAKACRVGLTRRPRSIVVSVEDDGQGATRHALERGGESHGVGLVGVRERATRLGGTCRLDTASGKGFRLTIELPIASDDTGRDETEPARAVVEPRGSVPHRPDWENGAA